jgi:uncharacterized membrane protein YkoI
MRLMMRGITTFAAILLAVGTAPALLAQDVAVKVKEAKAGLLAQALIKPDSAQKIALAAAPGIKITEVEIEEEKGQLVYEIHTAGPDGDQEIYVDAKTGAIVTFEKTDEPAAMGAGVSGDEAALLAEATVKADSAERIALQEVPGGTVSKRTIERKDGKLVYAFEIKVEGKDYGQTVLVDATTGQVIKSEDK